MRDGLLDIIDALNSKDVSRAREILGGLNEVVGPLSDLKRRHSIPPSGCFWALKQLNPNGIVEILADDSGFEEDVTNWCEATNNKLLAVTENEEEIIVAYVEKT